MSGKVNGKSHYTRNVDWPKVRDTQKKELDKGIKNHGKNVRDVAIAGGVAGGPGGAVKAVLGYAAVKLVNHCVNTYKRDL